MMLELFVNELILIDLFLRLQVTFFSGLIKNLLVGVLVFKTDKKK